MRHRSLLALMALAMTVGLAVPAAAQTPQAQSSPAGKTPLKHIIVVYMENWSFDSLYGLFPGANGLANAFSNHQFLYPQSNTGVGILGESLNPIPKPINNNVSPAVPDSRFPDPSVGNDLYAKPYNLLKYDVISADKTGDIVHRFWQEQAQI